jgi:hypothetical protein
MKKKSKPDEIDCPAGKGTVDLAPASAVPLEARFTVGAVVQPVSVADALSLRLAVVAPINCRSVGCHISSRSRQLVGKKFTWPVAI